MRTGMRHHHLRLTKGQNLLFVGHSDQGPIQPEFASLQKQKIAFPTRMLNHLVERQYHWPEPKKELPKNFERTGLIHKLYREQLFQRTNFILLLAKLGGKPFHN